MVQARGTKGSTGSTGWKRRNRGVPFLRVSNQTRLTYLTGVLAMLMLGCRARSSAVDGKRVARDPLAVAWAGCALVRTGPVCELGGSPRTLTLWIAGDEWSRAKAVIASDKGEIKPRVEEGIEGGTRLTVEVPAGASRLEVRNREGATRWSLAIGETKRGPLEEEIDRLVKLGRTGKYADALAGLDALFARTPASQQGPVHAAIGRMALGLGNVERAEPAFRASIAAAEADGRVSDVVRGGDALLWALVSLRQRYADARRLLEHMATFGAQYPEGRISIEKGGAMLAADTADIRTALERYRSVVREARRLGRTSMEANAADDCARMLTRLGRAEEAIVVQKKLPAPVDSCARAMRAINLSEAYMARASGHVARAVDPEVVAALAAARTATDACPDKNRRLLAVVNAADYALDAQSADSGDVMELVKVLMAAPPEPDVLRSSRRADVLGRWLLSQRKPAAALAIFEAQIPSARALGLLEETFRGEIGSGRALAALGRKREAIARFEQAQQLLEQMLLGIPLGEGRGTFIGGHDSGVRYLVNALVDGGNERRALQVARWIRSVELAHAARLDRLAALPADARRRWDDALERYHHIRRDIEREAADDWKLPRTELALRQNERKDRSTQARAALDEAYRVLVAPDAADPRALAEPTRDEIYVALFPAPDGWLVFAQTRERVIARRLARLDVDSEAAAARTGAAVLAMIDPVLAGARRVRLFPYASADFIDWASAPWRGRPLLASVEVEYGLDIGAPDRPHAASRESQRAALVIANPTGDLPGAGAEAEAVVAALPGWDVTRLEGSAATREATLGALPRARLLHYGGHARAVDGDGMPFSSALVLSGNARVELGDLLAAPGVPELVVLSACEAARTAAGTPSLMGLAQAFVAAGARGAIAPTRAVGDADARRFVAAFYGALARDGWGAMRDHAAGIEEIRAAFRHAVAELAVTAPGLGGVARGQMLDKKETPTWESFRLLVP
jgi:tetratricopeptide (TPR) repeat protein